MTCPNSYVFLLVAFVVLNFLTIFVLQSIAAELFENNSENLKKVEQEVVILTKRIEYLEQFLPQKTEPPAKEETGVQSAPKPSRFDVDVIVTLPSPLPVPSTIQRLADLVVELHNRGYSAQLFISFVESDSAEVRRLMNLVRFDLLEVLLVPVQATNLAQNINQCIGLGEAPLVVVLPFASSTEILLNSHLDIPALLSAFIHPNISIVGPRVVSMSDDDAELIHSAGYSVVRGQSAVLLAPRHLGFPAAYKPAQEQLAGFPIDLRGMALRRTVWAQTGGLPESFALRVRSPNYEHFLGIGMCLLLPTLDAVAVDGQVAYFVDSDYHHTPAAKSAGQKLEQAFYQTFGTRLEHQLAESYLLPGASLTWDPYCGCTGLNTEAIGFLFPLEDALHTSCISGPDCWCKGQPEAVKQTLSRTSRREANSSLFTIFVSHKPPQSFPRFPYRGNKVIEQRPDYVIGRSMSETTAISKQWVDSCNSRVDEVWVPTQFHAEVYTNSGVRPELIVVIPEPVNSNFFDPALAGEQESSKIFRFLSVGKWEPRKGFEFLLEAYWNEFTPEDKVSLTLHTYLYKHPKPRDKAAIWNKVKSVASSLGLAEKLAANKLPPVLVMSDELLTTALPKFYSNFDSFVLATRGEGWGLPIVEAMSMGLPVIVTNFSGPTEFLTPHNSFPVPVERLEEVPSGGDFGSAGKHKPA